MCKLELISSDVALGEGMSHFCHSCIAAFAFNAHPAMSVLWGAYGSHESSILMALGSAKTMHTGNLLPFCEVRCGLRGSCVHLSYLN